MRALAFGKCSRLPVVVEFELGQHLVDLQRGGQRLRALVADPGRAHTSGERECERSRLGVLGFVKVLAIYLFQDTSKLVSTLLTSRAEANAFAPSVPTALPMRLRTSGREVVSQGWP